MICLISARFYQQLNDRGIILIERASGNKVRFECNAPSLQVLNTNLTPILQNGMPYFKKGQWENSDEDRQFRDQLIVLLVNLGFEVRSKIFEEVIRQTKSEAKEQCATILTSMYIDFPQWSEKAPA